MRRLLLGALLLAGAAHAQPAAKCLLPGEIGSQQLLGTWEAELQGRWDLVMLRLVAHPEYAHSFHGTLERDGRRLLLAGDYEDGELTLEESEDGKRIAANWLGELVPESCGREIRGTWTRDGETGGKAFVLRKRER